LKKKFFNFSSFGNEKIFFREVYSAGVMFISDRDFIKISEYIKVSDNESYWINGNVDDHEEFSGFVRGKNVASGWHFKVEGDKTKVVMIYQTLFGGYLPQYLIDQNLLDAPMCLKLIEDGFKK
jgi:hypothetical protein